MSKQGKLYWLHLDSHLDPAMQGYVGVTITNGPNGRILSHFRKLRAGSHPNPKLQNAFNKYKEFKTTIIFEGSIDDCILKEIQLRPKKEIGWNLLEGGGQPPSHKSLHWYNNGITNQLNSECPYGFTAGKLQINGEKHGHFGKPKNYKVTQVYKFKKGMSHSEETIQKLRKPKKKGRCPHCGTIGGIGSLRRWHFDNCKIGVIK